MLEKLRIGIVLPDHKAPAWIVKTVESLAGMDEIDIAAVIHTGSENKTGWLYNLHFKLDSRVFRPTPNAWAEQDMSIFLKDVPVINAITDETFKLLKPFQFDVILNLSRVIYPNELMSYARFGVWTPYDGDSRFVSESAVGWREIVDDIHILRCAVEINRPGQPAQLAGESFLFSDTQSFTRNQAYMLWKVSAIIPNILKSLAHHGETDFFSRTKLLQGGREVNEVPSFFQSISLFVKQGIFTVAKKLTRYFKFDQWALLIKRGKPDLHLSWNTFERITPPKDRIWADPFLVERDGQTYLFIEEMLFKRGIGTINLLKLNHQGQVDSNQVLIERPYHMSYPFLFEHRGELYMLPETNGNNAIEVYRCVHFPDQWEFHKTLMKDLKAVDATLLEHDGRWWMFVTIAAYGNTTWDTLHLFHADDPLSDTWTAHPLNPVISDIRTARMAGRIYQNSAGLIRPSQNSSNRYGYGLNLNQIITLTTTEYAERQIDQLVPPPNSDVKAVHTFNYSENWTVMDMILRRPK